jgi:hypothetical protein
MISKHVNRPEDDRSRVGVREDVDRDDARRVADREARNEHDRRLASESGVPYVVPNGIDRRDDPRADER